MRARSNSILMRLLITSTSLAAVTLFITLFLPLAPSAEPLPSGSVPLQITTTTSMVTDLVKRVGGEHVVVQGLMGAGVDPHLYKASAGDISKLQRATVVFYSGLFLEGKMQEIFQRLAHT